MERGYRNGVQNFAVNMPLTHLNDALLSISSILPTPGAILVRGGGRDEGEGLHGEAAGV